MSFTQEIVNLPKFGGMNDLPESFHRKIENENKMFYTNQASIKREQQDQLTLFQNPQSFKAQIQITKKPLNNGELYYLVQIDKLVPEFSSAHRLTNTLLQQTLQNSMEQPVNSKLNAIKEQGHSEQTQEEEEENFVEDLDEQKIEAHLQDIHQSNRTSRQLIYQDVFCNMNFSQAKSQDLEQQQLMMSYRKASEN